MQKAGGNETAAHVFPWKQTTSNVITMAAASQKQKEKEPVNIVHQNAIFCETILKEQRHQKLYTSYGVNPYKKSKQAC